MLHYSHMAWTSCSRIVPDHSCISASHLMWVMKRTCDHSTMALKEIQRSNNAKHVPHINAWPYWCLYIYIYIYIYHSALTDTINQPLFNTLCSIVHFLMPHENWPKGLLTLWMFISYHVHRSRGSSITVFTRIFAVKIYDDCKLSRILVPGLRQI